MLPQSISQPDIINYITFIIKTMAWLITARRYTGSPMRNWHHHKIKSITKMEVEKLTGQQRFHRQSLVGKGSCVPGIKQSCKSSGCFYYDALLQPLKPYQYLLIAYSKAAVAPCQASVNKQ